MKNRRAGLSEQGFSLIALAIILVVLGVVTAGTLSGGGGGTSNNRVETTINRIDKIDASINAFKISKGRLPCPADASLPITDPNFGKETLSGTCSGSTLGPDTATTNLFGGVVPTKTLDIDDDFALDDYGRRMTYVVDKRSTANSTCTTLTAGGINLGGSISTPAMSVLISHGPNGHGAFPSQGSSIANRINAGSSDPDELKNASQNADFTLNFDGSFRKKERTATFDDIVSYQTNCCMGSMCEAPPGPTFPYPFVVTYDSAPFLSTYSYDSGTNRFITGTPSPFATLPTQTGDYVKFSPDNTYLAISGNPGGATSMLMVYKWDKTQQKYVNSTTINRTSTFTGGAGYVDWSPNGDLLAVAGGNNPAVKVFSRTNDTFTEIWPLVNTSQGIGTIWSTQFSPDGQHLFWGGSTGTRYKMQIVSGTTLTDPIAGEGLVGGNPPGAVRGMAFSPDGKYLAIGHQTVPCISVYIRSGSSNTYNLKTGGGTPTIAACDTREVKFSRDGKLLVVTGGGSISVYLTIFDVNSATNTFTKLVGGGAGNGTTTTINNVGYTISFTNDDQYMVVEYDSSPYVAFYRRSGTGTSTLFTRLPDLTPAPPTSWGTAAMN